MKYPFLALLLILAALVLSGCGGEPFRAERPSNANEPAKPASAITKEKSGGETKVPPTEETPPIVVPVRPAPDVTPDPSPNPFQPTPTDSGNVSDIERQIAEKEKELAKLRSQIAAAREADRVKKSPQDVAQLRSEWTQLKADCEAKKKQLATRYDEELRKKIVELESKQVGLRRRIAIAEGRAGSAVVSAKELLDAMPASAYPKYGTEGAIERKATRDWLAKNVVGRTIEWKRRINSVKTAGNDPYDITLVVESGTSVNTTHVLEFGTHPLGSAKCRVFVQVAPGQNRGFEDDIKQTDITYKCNETDGRFLLDLKGKEVVFQTTILTADVWDESRPDSRTFRPDDHLQISLEVDLPAVNGFLPSPVVNP